MGDYLMIDMGPRLASERAYCYITYSFWAGGGAYQSVCSIFSSSPLDQQALRLQLSVILNAAAQRAALVYDLADPNCFRKIGKKLTETISGMQMDRKRRSDIRELKPPEITWNLNRY